MRVSEAVGCGVALDFDPLHAQGSPSSILQDLIANTDVIFTFKDIYNKMDFKTGSMWENAIYIPYTEN